MTQAVLFLKLSFEILHQRFKVFLKFGGGFSLKEFPSSAYMSARNLPEEVLISLLVCYTDFI